MCRVNGDVLPECPCPTECSDDVDPHCSVYLGDYENLCKVHLHACKMQINVAVKHRGRCAGMGPFLLSEYFPPPTNEVYFLYLKKRENVTQNDGSKPRSYVSLKIYFIYKIAGSVGKKTTKTTTRLLLPEPSRNECVAWRRAISLHLRGQLSASENTSWHTAVAWIFAQALTEVSTQIMVMVNIRISVYR